MAYLPLAIDTNDTSYATESLRMRCNIETKLGNTSKAKQHCADSLKILTRENNNLGRAKTLNELGRLFRRMGCNETAAAYHRSALGIVGEQHPSNIRADAKIGLGWIAAEELDIDNARDLFNEALTLYRQDHNKLGEANALQALAWADMSAQSKHRAKALNEPLEIYKSLGNLFGQAIVYERLGWLALQQGQVDVAERHYSEAERAYQALDVPLGQVKVLVNRGYLEQTRRRLDVAREALVDALRLSQLHADLENQLIALTLLSNIERNDNNRKLAANYRAMSLKLSTELADHCDSTP